MALFSWPAFAQSDNERARDWLTDEERAWLSEHPVLRHGVVVGHEPFEFTDSDGSYTGLTSDYFAIISERLGLTIETSLVDSIGDLNQGIRDETLDIASYLPLPPAREVASRLAWTDPFISMPIAVFGRADSVLLLDFDALSEWTVAIEVPSRAAELLSVDRPDLEFVTVDSPLEGIRAVHDGEVDYFIHNVFSVEYFQRELGIEPLRVALQTPYVFDIKLSVRPELAPLIPMIHKVIDDLSNHERTLIFNKWVNRQDESVIDWEKAVTIAAAGAALFLGVLGAVLFWNRRLSHEVAERTHEVEKSREDMRALALHMDHIREEEKSRIALEMHDELGHSLTALSMGLRRLGTSLRNDRAYEPEPELDELRGLLRHATATSRRIMSDLRPSVLNDLGLVAAIEWLAHEFESNHGINCAVDAEDLEIDLPERSLTALFRIIQESLTNVAKHAEAHNVAIRLLVDEAGLTLEIEDDGVGIQESRSDDGHFGLMGMGERALALGGEFSVTRRRVSGTRVRVFIGSPELAQDLEVQAGM